ncbi:hypothetical protein JZ751_012230 [Albula glossodonta]|uniref:Uncharacterized protein n=1 Tax=Albula glossodonta TaxID=121402 RepID=A0A8T2PS11_9TELE|nr:hypothetical protein JZ751_012230 [Albula glossodonta]
MAQSARETKAVVQQRALSPCRRQSRGFMVSSSQTLANRGWVQLHCGRDRGERESEKEGQWFAWLRAHLHAGTEFKKKQAKRFLAVTGALVTQSLTIAEDVDHQLPPITARDLQVRESVTSSACLPEGRDETEGLHNRSLEKQRHSCEIREVRGGERMIGLTQLLGNRMRPKGLGRRGGEDCFGPMPIYTATLQRPIPTSPCRAALMFRPSLNVQDLGIGETGAFVSAGLTMGPHSEWSAHVRPAGISSEFQTIAVSNEFAGGEEGATDDRERGLSSCGKPSQKLLQKAASQKQKVVGHLSPAHAMGLGFTEGDTRRGYVFAHCHGYLLGCPEAGGCGIVVCREAVIPSSAAGLLDPHPGGPLVLPVIPLRDSCLDQCCNDPDPPPSLSPPRTEDVLAALNFASRIGVFYLLPTHPDHTEDTEEVTGSGLLRPQETGCQDGLCVNIHVHAAGKRPSFSVLPLNIPEDRVSWECSGEYPSPGNPGMGHHGNPSLLLNLNEPAKRDTMELLGALRKFRRKHKAMNVSEGALCKSPSENSINGLATGLISKVLRFTAR